jgi:hypothetical protein
MHFEMHLQSLAYASFGAANYEANRLVIADIQQCRLGKS